ncbi:MAG: hypothetical protein RBT55_03710 [Rhodocyclaceae bacterium]|jgi:hypothetical protein|nr:hypothetical protein [Rhodocyclaceae bacterium]
MSKNRVFVVQNQHRWNRDNQRFEPKFDLSPAEEFGELVYLLSPTAAPFRPEPVIEELRAKLADFGPDDHLLLVGNPVLIGFAVALAAQSNGGDVSLLQWSGKDQRYINVIASGLFTSSD